MTITEHGEKNARAGSARSWSLAVLEYLALGAVALLIVGLYLPLVVQEPILSRDDKLMLTTLRAATDSGYWNALVQGKVLDVQPVRDLSLWLDMRLGELLGRPVFHGTQIVLWLLCGLVVHAILQELGWVRTSSDGQLTPCEHGGLDGSSQQRIAAMLRVGLTAVFLLHPITLSSVAWIAARKHVLACLFLACATLRVLRWRRLDELRPWREAGVLGGLYLLAMASQPLGILWPVWLAVFVGTRVRAAQRALWVALGTVLFPLMMCTAAVNHRYYTLFYPLEHGGPKLVDAPWSLHFLALGRYFAQLTLPVSISTTEFSTASPLNVVGLVGFVMALVLLLRRGPRRERLGWVALYLVVLAPVTVQMTNIFGSDTYALLPLLALCCLLGDPACALLAAPAPQLGAPANGLLAATAPHRRRLLAMGFTCVGVLFGTFVFLHVDDWSDDSRFWRASYREGVTPENATQVAYHELRADNVDEALALAWKAYALDPHARNLHLVLPEAIYRSNTLDSGRKLALLHDLRFASPWPAYYGALLYAERGHYEKGWDLMARILARPVAFGAEVERVVATAIHLCTRAQATGCDALAAQAQGNMGAGTWDQSRFEANLRAAPVWDKR